MKHLCCVKNLSLDPITLSLVSYELEIPGGKNKKLERKKITRI
jgi:hypothetical protein